MDDQRRPGGASLSGGFTLIEMLVSLAVLSVVLSAVAASLITFTRASADNERRVQSTAFLNSLHEELQVLPWPDATLYADEIAALADVGVDMTASPPEFEGEPLSLRPGPGCADPSCRIESIPRAHETGVVSSHDGRVYTVYRIITEVSRGGTAERDVKRFSTVVRWESFGEVIEQRFDSERAPSPDEYALANVPEVTQFLISPAENQLDENGRSYTTMSVSVRFRDDVTGAVLHFPDGVDTLALTRDGTSNRFSGVIPADKVFVHGERNFEVRGGYASGGFASATTAVTFLEWIEGVVAPPAAPVVTSVVPTPLTLRAARMASYGNGTRLCEALTVRVRVDGLVPPATSLPSDASVTAFYEGQYSSEGAGLVSSGGIDGLGDEFVLEFPKGSLSPWNPGHGNTVYDAFTVTARNGDGPQSLLESSVAVAISGPTHKNEKC